MKGNTKEIHQLLAAALAFLAALLTFLAVVW